MQVDEMKHAHRLELANVRMEFLKARGEVERERDRLQTQVESRFPPHWPLPFLTLPHSLLLFIYLFSIEARVKRRKTLSVVRVLSVSGLQTDLEVLSAAGERNKELLSEKEQEMVHRIQAARDEEMKNTVALQEEK